MSVEFMVHFKNRDMNSLYICMSAKSMFYYIHVVQN